jgi:hypothetical protein
MLEEVVHRCNDVGIELRTSGGLQYLQRRLGQNRAPIRPIGRQGMKRIRNRDDARFDRDFFVPQAVGITLAVDAFVMRANDRCKVRQLRQRGQQARTAFGMKAHLDPLVGGQ